MPPLSEAVAAPAPGERWADAARVLLILAAIGTFTSPALVNIAAGLGLVAFFISPGAVSRLRAGAARPLGIGLLVFACTMALAMLWADVDWGRRFAAWWGWRTMLLLLVASTLFGEPRWKDRFALALVGVLAVAAAVSFLVLLLPNPVLIDEPGVILRNHTTQGMALIAGTVLAGMLAWGRPLSQRVRRLLMVAILLFIANLALITTGRTAHVALLVAVGVSTFSLLPGQRRLLASAGIFVAVLAVLASSSMVRQRFETAYGELGTITTAKGETPMGARIIIWTTTLDLIARRPLLGYGVGGFAPAFAQAIQQRHSDGWQPVEAKDTHNQYLHILVEAGIPGGLAFLAFLAGVLRQRAQAPYRGAALALLATWLVSSLFNSHFQTFGEAHLIALLLGVLLAGDGPDYARASSAATTAATSS